MPSLASVLTCFVCRPLIAPPSLPFLPQTAKAVVNFACAVPYTEFWSRGLNYPILSALQGHPVVHIVDFGLWRRQWVAVLKHLANHAPLVDDTATASASAAASPAGCAHSHANASVRVGSTQQQYPIFSSFSGCNACTMAGQQGSVRVSAPCSCSPAATRSPDAWLPGTELADRQAMQVRLAGGGGSHSCTQCPAHGGRRRQLHVR